MEWYNTMETFVLALVYIGIATVGTGTHASAAYSEVTANTTAVPCTVSAHTPNVLPGCLL